MYIYENGFDVHNQLGNFDLNIKKIIYNQLHKGDAFINLTWCEDNRMLKHIFECKPNNIYLYSGIDPHYVPPPLYNYLQNYKGNVYNIGNYNGDFYFFWWLHFLKDKLHKFAPFNTYDIADDYKVYMCLNRKPHPHRQVLVKNLIDYGVFDDGYVSLGRPTEGFTNIFNLDLPFTLKNDIVDTQGDNVVYGDVGISNNIFSVGSKHYWNSHIINIVTETSLIDGGFISEKTIKAIVGKRPFMVYGDSQIYDILKDIGIDTFDDIFGERPYSHTSQVTWVCDNILNFKNDKHLDKLLLFLKPRLESNYNVLLSYCKTNYNNLLTLIKKPVS